MKSKYWIRCSNCQQVTPHKENSNLLADLIVAFTTKFKADLRNDILTCRLCGKENKSTI